VIGLDIDEWGKNTTRVAELKNNGIDVFNILQNADNVERGLKEITQFT
jgi:hypothetical protein